MPTEKSLSKWERLKQEIGGMAIGILAAILSIAVVWFNYCDCWLYCSDMEVRPHNPLYDDVVAWSDVYPRMSVITQLKRNGFKGDL